MTIDEAFDVLGLPPDADYVTARRTYRARARSCHPDTASPEARGAAADEMSQVNAAWAIVRGELRTPALGSAEEIDAEERAFWDAAPVPQEPTPRRRSGLLVGSVAALVLAAATGAVVATTAGGATAQDYVGACLTEQGDVVDCSADRAELEVSSVLPSPDGCDGVLFSDAGGDSYFCAVPRES